MARTVRFDPDHPDDPAPRKPRLTPKPLHTSAAGFVCVNCKAYVNHNSTGTRNRNHCPLCLWSRHVDDAIGDRASPCRAPMEPIALAVRGGPAAREWCLVHRCTACSHLRTNRIAGDDSERSLLALALRPLANPPFPLDVFGG